MVWPGAKGSDGPNQADIGIHNPLTRPRDLIGSTANVQNGPELSEDRRMKVFGEDVDVV